MKDMDRLPETLQRCVALLEVQDKEYRMTPIPLRTVRPFVVDDVCLEIAAEKEGFDLGDKMAITKFLKKKVEELIVRANEQWDERNAKAVAEGETELPRMLPLIRLKVGPIKRLHCQSLKSSPSLGRHNRSQRNVQPSSIRPRIPRSSRQPSRCPRLPPSQT